MNRRLADTAKRLWQLTVTKVVTGIAAIFLLWLAVMFITTPRPLFGNNYATVVIADDGSLLGARLAPDEQWRFPPIDTTPEKLAMCLIMFEDKNFYRHHGVDAGAVVRAVYQNVSSRHIQSGASTITMQLARLSYGHKRRTFLQKLRETNRAIFLELTMSKQRILSSYASHAPFGGNVVGASAAAWRYFGRSADKLSWAEAATLAVLPNSPSLIHMGKNRARLAKKRDWLLLRLKNEGIISDTDYSLAVSEPLPTEPLPLPNSAPHLLTRVWSERPGQQTVTTIRYDLQQNVQNTVNRYVEQYKSNYIHHMAVVVAEVETGNVTAYVGNTTSPNDERGSNQVDVAVAPRSSGSILKPFLYAAMLTDGSITPTMLIPDIPLNFNGFSPQNFSRKFSGAVPAAEALRSSLNVPLVRMLQRYNVARFLTLLRKIGLTTLPFDDQHYGATLILGGAEVSLMDLCGAYASMARDLNRKDNTVSDYRQLSFIPGSKPRPIESPFADAAIYTTFEAMSNLNRPEEESTWQMFRSMKKIAWKTGTSYGSRDAWCVGVTPSHVVGVWVGNADGEGRAGMTGVGFAAPVMFSVFSMLPNDGWFEQPLGEMELIPICRQSGFRAGNNCIDIDTLIMPLAVMKTECCPYHHLIHLSPDRKYQVNSSCMPVSQIITEPRFVLPPTMAYYYRQQHIDYEPIPPYHPQCQADLRNTMQIIYPENGSKLVRTIDFDGNQSLFVFRAAHAGSSTIYWHIDDSFIGSTTELHELSVNVAPGRHTLTIVDTEGNRATVRFEAL